MAPTICLSELSVHADNNPGNCYMRRRQRAQKTDTPRTSKKIIIKEEQRIELKRIFNNNSTLSVDRVTALSPPASPVWESPTCPAAENSTTHLQTSSANLNNRGERWRSILARREGLLDIVGRTMALVRRSHMLQKRVNALRYETREFIRSVLNNPENNAGRKQFMESKTLQLGGMSDSVYVETAASSSNYSNSEVLISSRAITPPPTPDSSTTEYIAIDDDTINAEQNYNADDCNCASARHSTSPISSCDYSSNYSECIVNNIINEKVTQDPMVSSS